MNSTADTLQSLVGSAVLIAIGTFLGNGLALLAEILIARSLNPMLYGKISLAYTIISVLGSILVFGTGEGITRLSSSKDDMSDKLEIIRSGLFIVVVASILGAIVTYQLRNFVSNVLSQPSLARIITYFIPYLLLYPISVFVLSLLRSFEKTTHMVLSRDFVSRITSIGVLFVMLNVGLSEAGPIIYWTSFPVFIIISVFILNFSYIKFKFFTVPSKSNIKSLWSFSWPLAAGSIIFLALSRIDIIMIGYFLPAREVGIYRAIQPLQKAATIVLSSFSFLFLPIATNHFEDGEFNKLERIFRSVTKWSVLITLPLIFVFTISASSVVNLLFGTQYASAATPLAILSGGLFIRTIVGPNGDMVKAINMPRVELYSSLLGLLSNIILNVLLIPEFGISGAAVATVGGYTVYNITELYIIYESTGITPISTSVIKPIVLGTFIVVVLSRIFITDNTLVNLCVIALLAVISIMVALITTNSVEEEDMVVINMVESRLGVELEKIKNILRMGVR